MSIGLKLWLIIKMVLEAVVVIMDNSEYNRNGDFAPSRWESQQDAANNIIDVKLN